MPFGQAALSFSGKSGARWSTAASKPNSSISARHLSAPPAMPTARQPLSFAIWPTSEPTGPVAAATTTVSPGFGWPMLRRPGIGGHARHAEDAERGRGRRRRGVDLAQLLAVEDGVFLPAAHAEREVAGREFRVVRAHHLADDAAGHDLADADRLGIGLRIAHAPAHVGVEREPERAQQDLARTGLGDRRRSRAGSRSASARRRGARRARCGGSVRSRSTSQARCLIRSREGEGGLGRSPSGVGKRRAGTDSPPPGIASLATLPCGERIRPPRTGRRRPCRRRRTSCRRRTWRRGACPR